MANKGNQKIKILRLMEIFEKETDEEHPLNASQLVKRLAEYDIEAERKSIYSDVAILQDFGMDIIKADGANGGYFLASRDFELAELKLLVDAVTASKFITEKKSRELTSKIETMAGIEGASALRRQVVVTDRTKTENESILYTIDVIHCAIANDHRLNFQYTDYDANKNKIIRHDGRIYEVSPAFLLWDNENYYLVAYSDEDKEIRHYRVDKMINARENELTRLGTAERKAAAEIDYSNATFGMFAGEETKVHLRFPSNKIGIIIDRFGTDIPVRPDGEGYLVTLVTVNVSNQFFGWVDGIGGDIVITGPDSVIERYKEHLKKLINNY